MEFQFSTGQRSGRYHIPGVLLLIPRRDAYISRNTEGNDPLPLIQVFQISLGQPADVPVDHPTPFRNHATSRGRRCTGHGEGDTGATSATSLSASSTVTATSGDAQNVSIVGTVTLRSRSRRSESLVIRYAEDEHASAIGNQGSIWVRSVKGNGKRAGLFKASGSFGSGSRNSQSTREVACRPCRVILRAKLQTR